MEIFVFGAKKAFKITKNVVSKSYNMEIRSPAKSYNMEKKRSGLHRRRLFFSDPRFQMASVCLCVRHRF